MGRGAARRSALPRERREQAALEAYGTRLRGGRRTGRRIRARRARHTPAEAAAQRSAFLDAVSRAVLSSLDTGQRQARPRPCRAQAGGRGGGLDDQPRRGPRLPRYGDRRPAQGAESESSGPPNTMTKERRPTFVTRVFRQSSRCSSPISSVPCSRFRTSCRPKRRRSKRSGSPRASVSRSKSEVRRSGLWFSLPPVATSMRTIGPREDIAARVAAALQNARMYGIAQGAIRARDDFLVLVAHDYEPRSPLCSSGRTACCKGAVATATPKRRSNPRQSRATCAGSPRWSSTSSRRQPSAPRASSSHTRRATSSVVEAARRRWPTERGVRGAPSPSMRSLPSWPVRPLPRRAGRRLPPRQRDQVR